MDEKLKSAFEIAMEKVAKLGNLSPQEELELKWVPEGERLAARYLRGEGDLAGSLATVDRSATRHVLNGALSVLLPRLGIPRNEAAASDNRRVMDGLKSLCKDGKAFGEIAGRVKYVEEQYLGYGRKLMEQTYQELKQTVTSQVQSQIRKQGVRVATNFDIESMPEFQAQWRAAVARQERHYEQNLDELRKQLRELILAKPVVR